ncbi:MAG: TspO/MBR family protein [Pseudomonadota bacterium]
MIDWLVLFGFGVAAMAAASTGAAFPPGDWYKALNKPAWTPPNWLFPVAWTALYIGIVIAAWRMALSDHPLAPLAIAAWSAQIALNAVWSPVFFGLRSLGGAMGVLVALWLAVAATLVVASYVDGTAALLFVPYLVWVSYAGALNFAIWRGNPEHKPLSAV